MSLLLKNCKLIHRGKNVIRNIFIENGIIRKITTENMRADAVINARHNYVIPGMIDSHVHFRAPGSEYKEDFFTGSRAAAAGGVTTVLDMPNTPLPTTSLRALMEKRQAAKKSIVNYGFHFGATMENSGEIRNSSKYNVASVKVFMGSSTGNLLINNDGRLYEIFCDSKLNTIHAENEDLIGYFEEKYRRKTNYDLHCDIRNNLTAYTAVSKAISLSRACSNKLYFCHVSTRQEISMLKDEAAYVEITPHHLFLAREDMKTLGNFGKMNPPLRSKDDQTALWEAINDGTADTIGSDHAPHLPQEKNAPYKKAPSGVPGVETSLPLMLDAVNRGLLALPRLVELTSINPARIFGIKNKGLIKEGYDADLVIIDMDMEKRIRNENLFTKCGWSPFDGRKVRGWPVTTIVNGNVVFHEGKVYDRKRGKEVEFE